MTSPKGIDRNQIWDMYQLGIPKTRIARNLGIHRNTVDYHLERMQKEREVGLTPEPPRSLTEANDTIQTDCSTASPNAEGIGASQAV